MTDSINTALVPESICFRKHSYANYSKKRKKTFCHSFKFFFFWFIIDFNFYLFPDEEFNHSGVYLLKHGKKSPLNILRD